MPELDFHGLRDEIGDAARQPEFASVMRRASRIRTRRYSAATGTAAVLTLAVALAGSTLASGGTRPSGPPGGAAGPGVGSSAGVPSGGPARAIEWAGAADALHLYAVLTDCDECPRRLVGSADGGRSWRTRHTFGGGQMQWFAPRLITIGPESLLFDAPLAGQPGARLPGFPAGFPKAHNPVEPVRSNWRLTTDGGATWRDVAKSKTPVAAATAGSPIVSCEAETRDADNCVLYVLDPAAGRLAPLANQPPLLGMDVTRVPASAGLWVQGYHRDSERPAMAVSRDNGRTWTTTVFTEEPPVAASTGRPRATQNLPNVTTADGRTAYAMFVRGAAPPRVYRSTDGGRTWKRTNGDTPVSEAPLSSPESWVTADGAHVILDQPDGLARFLVSADGRRYTPMTVTGLQDEIASGEPMRLPTMAGGRYLYQSANRAYVSDDGRRWQPVLP
ncbi:MAG TPA: sialidase family protein [Catenuloplanes sp.]|jgi:hypothetical protein